jgi:hypothetical protein
MLEELTKLIIRFSMKVHNALGPGFVEFVYRNSLLGAITRVRSTRDDARQDSRDLQDFSG